MGRFAVEITVANNHDLHMVAEGTLAPDQVRRVPLKGVVDPGATRLVLPESVVVQLGLPVAGETKVRYADLRTAHRPIVEEVWLEILGRHGTFRAIVEPQRTTALIGAIVLEDLDFLVDCITQTLQPRDPDRIVSEVE